MTILLRQKPLPQVVRQIVQRDNGAWFDPEDMSTMYQDSTGTTPVTALEQPVGRWLDKSGNGNHATQSVTAARPVISARYNLLTKTEDFTDNIVWSKSSTTMVANAALSPINTQTADKVVLSSGAVSTGNNQVGSFGAISMPSNGSPCCFAIYAAPAETEYIRIREAVNSGSRVRINLTNGSFVGEVGWNPSIFQVSVTPSENGFFKIVITRTAPVTFGFNLKSGMDVGDGVSGFYVWGADMRTGSTIDRYQRVNTSTDYDTVGFKKYIKFDGVDDYLNLPYLGLYANGSASIVAARDALSQAVDTYVISERSASNVNPKYFPSRQLANAGNMDAYIVNDSAAVVVDTVGSAYGGASDAVIRSVVDSGNNIKLFKNGALAANDNYTRSGALTLTNTTIGASVSTTTSNYASMKLYGLIITKSALTDAQRVMCERFLARKAGVML